MTGKTLTLAAVVLVLVALPATGQVKEIRPSCVDPDVSVGTDFWVTPNTGTHADIPSGFLCSGSTGFTVDFKGKALVSSPSLGQTDTVIERLDPICFDANGEASDIRIRVVALSLEGTSSISECGDTWTVTAHRRPPGSGETAVTTIDVSDDGDGGTFTGALNVPAQVNFKDSSGDVQSLDMYVQFSMTAPWATEPGEGGVVVSGPITVDTDGDGDLSDETTTFPGNDTGFHPGWDPTTNPPVPVQVEHDGLDESHFTDPIPPPSTCDPDVIRYLEKEPSTEYTTNQVGSSVVVGLKAGTVIEGKSVSNLTPCRFADASVTYTVGIAR